MFNLALTRSFMTPEEAALLDASMEGEARLRGLHITRLTDGRDLGRWIEMLSGDHETRVCTYVSMRICMHVCPMDRDALRRS